MEKYFKQHRESGDTEFTIVGSYTQENITEHGDLLCQCDIIEHRYKRYSYDHIHEYLELDEIEEIDFAEYTRIKNTLAMCEQLKDVMDKLLSSIL